MSVLFSPRRRPLTCGICAAIALAAPAVRADDHTVSSALAPAVPAPVGFKIKTSPYRPMAGSSATLTATIKPPDTEKKRIVGGLFFVREDLGQLFFNEPVRREDDTFENTVVLPSGGEWRVFGSVITELDADKGETVEMIVGPEKLSIDGARPVREPLIPQVVPTVRINNYALTLKQPTRIVAENEQKLVFTLLDGQTQQVSDMDIWRGALAHLILVDKDVKTLLHITPDPTDPRTGRTGTLVFPTRFPKAGIWRGWVLFQRTGQVFTLPLVLRVLSR
jgi:hypothetical protein